MRVTVTGATGRIGSLLVERLRARGDEVTILSRSAREGAVVWNPMTQRAPAAALESRDAVIHLAGEDVAQRWTAEAKERIRESREIGTRHLVEGLADVAPERRPTVLVSGSASGYYGPHGDEEVTEAAAPGADFLAAVCVAWEAEAQAAEPLG